VLKGNLFIGTSGYSFPDWKGVVYPKGLPQNRWLEHYAGHFNLLELNVSYYRQPAPATIERLVNLTPPDFRVVIKAHQSISHGGEVEPAASELIRRTEPLGQADKHLGFLVQFPYSFRNDKSNRYYLTVLKRSFQGYPLYFEFRHDGWLTEGVKELLEQLEVSWVNADLPELQGLPQLTDWTTSNRAYLRLHGRNRKSWWPGTPGERYDYNYSREELQALMPALSRMDTSAEETLIFFNNCHAGQAVKNALLLRELMEEL
jgi:uncharacterized protein YecE (DUF72 family)